MNIWIDCDPGIDDAVMLSVAGANQDKLHICGISTVSGNQGIETVTDNAVHLAAMLKMKDVPVVQGSGTPLLRVPEDAGYVHGSNGIGGVILPDTDKKQEEGNAIVRMREAILNLPEGEKMILVPTGPMTNIALLLKVFPEVKNKIEKIVSMGGGSDHGNTVPWAEFNVYSDPEAAEIVYNCGLPIIMCGLDITECCHLTRTNIAKVAAMNNIVPQKLGAMMTAYAGADFYEGSDCICMHDVTTMMYLLHPELFRGISCTVHVMRDDKEPGRTVCTPDENGNVWMLNDGDLETYEKFFLEIMESWCAA